MSGADWEQAPFHLPPVASAVGPFPGRDFLATLWRHCARPEEELRLIYRPDALLPLVQTNAGMRFVGESDFVDYRSPLGEGCLELVAEVVEQLAPGGNLSVDSLPWEAAEVVAKGVERAGAAVEVSEHTVAAVLELPADFDEYLGLIGKKERHEVRRKRRRYQQVVGEIAHETHRQPGWGLDEFVRLHRLAPGAKGSFMTPRMEALFRDLVRLPGWRVDLLRVGERAAAAVFGYSDASGYYLYNSSYDPALSEGSPGVVLLGTMIERAIAEGMARFDFLKGNETYKFRLGASSRPLYRVETAA